MKKTGVQLIDSVENYGWHQVSYVCFAAFLEKCIAALVLYIVSIMAAAIVSILYSYLFYKKKMAAGEKLKIQYNKKTIVIYVIVSVSVVIFTIWTLFWGGIDISFHDNDFTVEAQGWSDYTVDYEQIDSISYKENLFQKGMIAEQMVWET